MIQKLNEYMIQQTQKPIGELASDEPDWDNALYFFVSDPDPARELGLFCGFEIFPNHGIQRATYHLRDRGEQYRGMSITPLGGGLGPLLESGFFRFECLDPMARWRIGIADADQGVEVDLEYTARCKAYAHRHVKLPGGYAAAIDQRHYNQSGRFQGVLRVGGETSRAQIGMKNRSWGVRNWHLLPMYHWTTAQFDEFSVNTWLFEDQDGRPLFVDGAITTEKGEVTPVVAVEHELELHAGSTKRVRARHVRITTANGEVLRLEGREIGSIPLARLPDHYSESDPTSRAEAEASALWFEQHTAFSLGDQRGIGFVEHCVAPGCRKHGIAPTHFPSVAPNSLESAPAPSR